MKKHFSKYMLCSTEYIYTGLDRITFFWQFLAMCARKTIRDLKNLRTLLKIKVLYWNQWFLEEPLTTMESFHCTKGSFLWFV